MFAWTSVLCNLKMFFSTTDACEEEHNYLTAEVVFILLKRNCGKCCLQYIAAGYGKNVRCDSRKLLDAILAFPRSGNTLCRRVKYLFIHYLKYIVE
jgi:hypothetical protein